VITYQPTETAEAQQPTWFEFVVALTSHGNGFDVYDAEVRMPTEGVGGRVVIDRVEVTIAPETAVDLFTAAAVAAEKLAPLGYQVAEDITSYGTHGKGVMVR